MAQNSDRGEIGDLENDEQVERALHQLGGGAEVGDDVEEIGLG